MKILWLSHAVPWPPKSGMLQRSYNLIRQVVRSHEVHLLALNNRSLLPSRRQLAVAASELRDICASVRVHSIVADRSPFGRSILLSRSLLSSMPYDVHWLRNAAFRRAVDDAIRFERFDLVHVDTLGLWPYVHSRGWVPIVLNHHDIESHKLSRRACREQSLVKRLYLSNEARKMARFEQHVCREAEVNLVVSPLDAERLRAIEGAVRIQVVDNGVDLDYFRASASAVSRGLIFVGGMSFYANREAVLFLMRRIWPALAQDDPQRTLTIVGKDPPKEVRAWARDPRVAVTGFVQDVRPHIDRAAIYVCPIFSGGGTRIKVLDALAMEKPLVATALAVEGLGLQEHKHYLRAEQPSEFVAQIRRLEEDPGLRERLARAGRELVESRFSWEKIALKLNAAYERGVERRRLPDCASAAG